MIRAFYQRVAWLLALFSLAALALWVSYNTEWGHPGAQLCGSGGGATDGVGSADAWK